MSTSAIALPNGTTFSNQEPLVLIAGMNVIEGEQILDDVAAHLVDVTCRLGMPLVFKASFDKANRSSINSFRGPGIEDGLRLLDGVRRTYNVPIVTDVHEPWQAERVAAVADIIQIPAFLARQTDLVRAVAETGRVINIKKPQFLAPGEMGHIITKCREAGNDQVLLCERGSSFGYNNLVVDMLGMDLMKAMAPVVFDVTHALQTPGSRSDSAGGRGAQAFALGRAGVAVGIAGLFVEVHPDPAHALCDGPSALKMADIEPFLQQMTSVDRAVKEALRAW